MTASRGFLLVAPQGPGAAPARDQSKACPPGPGPACFPPLLLFGLNDRGLGERHPEREGEVGREARFDVPSRDKDSCAHRPWRVEPLRL